MGMMDMGGLPPLQLGSSATSGASGGSNAGGGMGALNEGNWITETTGTGNNAANATSTPGPTAAAGIAGSGNPLMLLLLAGGALWLMRRK